MLTAAGPPSGGCHSRFPICLGGEIPWDYDPDWILHVVFPFLSSPFSSPAGLISSLTPRDPIRTNRSRNAAGVGEPAGLSKQSPADSKPKLQYLSPSLAPELTRAYHVHRHRIIPPVLV